MEINNMIKVICQIADVLGYEHRENHSASRLRLELEKDDQFFILTPIVELRVITIACSVINIGLDIEENDRAELLNQMNLRLDCNSGCLALLPDLTFEDQLEMILTKDLYAMSALHLKKALPEVLASMNETRTFYVNALTQIMTNHN